tara:strand:+ start:1019 stop:1198 length:180 start_codon:yes stop_codon:yes gene_type:complete
MNKMMTVLGAAALGATLAFLFFELEGQREVMFAGLSYLAGIVTALLAAIDHIIPKQNEE